MLEMAELKQKALLELESPCVTSLPLLQRIIILICIFKYR